MHLAGSQDQLIAQLLFIQMQRVHDGLIGHAGTGIGMDIRAGLPRNTDGAGFLFFRFRSCSFLLLLFGRRFRFRRFLLLLSAAAEHRQQQRKA